MAGIIPVLGTSTAMALSIDFTASTWNGAQGQTSYTVGNVNVSATGGAITVNYIGGPSGDNSGNDGLGIGDDEITQGGTELLTISFADPVTLTSIYLTDLFRNEGGVGNHEMGWYSIDGGGPTSFTAAPLLQAGLNGELNINSLNLQNVHNITFGANKDWYSDYSVKGLTYTAVPEPSTLLLLGCGFVLLAILHRRGFFPSV